MERIHQMHVVPDVLPDLRPTIDLRVTFPEPPPNSVYLRTRIKRAYKPVEPGLFLLPEQVRHPAYQDALDLVLIYTPDAQST